MTEFPNDNELVVQKANLSPIEQSDSRNGWQKFIDGVRQTIGLKPIHLAERWAEAKVRQEEVDSEARMLAAKANYELAMAQVRKMEREGQSKQDVDGAIADFIRQQSGSPEIVMSILKNLRDASSQSPEEALGHLQDVIKKIEFQGGDVELDLPNKSGDTSTG